MNASWIHILECISYLDACKLIAKKDEYKETKNNEGEIIVQVSFNVDQIDKLFSKSNLLDESSIIDFISAICNVSKQELNNDKAPRIYFL